MYIVRNEAAEKDAQFPVLSIGTSAWTHTEGKNQTYKITQKLSGYQDGCWSVDGLRLGFCAFWDVSKALTVSISGRSNPVYVDAAVGKKGMCRFQGKLGGDLANQGLL
jgi:hypothetical protein